MSGSGNETLFEPFPFPHATTIRVGHSNRLLLSQHSMAAGVLPQQEWRVRFIGPALVAAALAWHPHPVNGFVVEFVLPLPGHYTTELLLEYNDTRLDGINPLCRDGALGDCYLRRNTSAVRVDCMDAGGVQVVAQCMKACNEYCGAPALVHKLIPLKHPQLLAAGPGFLSRSFSPCVGHAALGAGVWVDRAKACSEHGISVAFGHSRGECERAIINCASVRSQVGTRESLKSICNAQWVWRPFKCALRPILAPGLAALPHASDHHHAQRMPAPAAYAEVQFVGVSTTRELMAEFEQLGGAVAGKGSDGIDGYEELSAHNIRASSTISVLAMTPCVGNPVGLTLRPDVPSDLADLQGCVARMVLKARRAHSRFPAPVVLQRAAHAAPYLYDHEEESMQVKYHGVRGWQGVDASIAAWNDMLSHELVMAASSGVVDYLGQLDEEVMSAPFWGGQRPGDPLQVSRDGLHWIGEQANRWFLANVALLLLNVCVGLDRAV